MIRNMKKRGFQKTAAQTPQEFVKAINNETLRVRVANFTEHYESARFGESVEDVRRLPELFAEIARGA